MSKKKKSQKKSTAVDKQDHRAETMKTLERVAQLYKDGKTGREIADAIGKKVSTTSGLMFRARQAGLIGYRISKKKAA